MEFNKSYQHEWQKTEFEKEFKRREQIKKTKPNIMQEGNSTFFQNVDVEEIRNMTDGELDDNCCCATKALAYELLHFVRQNRDFPFSAESVQRRLPNRNLNIHEMRFFNIMALKLMRRFDNDK